VVQCLWAAFLMTFIFQSICCSNLQHCNTFTPSLCLGWAFGSQGSSKRVMSLTGLFLVQSVFSCTIQTE
jgi:hypothetical protein